MNRMSDNTVTELREYIKSRLHEYPVLNLHLVSAHCNGAALGHSPADAADDHQHEHDGPGTIRNHDRDDLFWNADKIADIILECVEADTDAEARAEVDRLMAPARIRFETTPDQHAHKPATEALIETADGVQWEVCPDGTDCRTYPRYYGLSTTVDAFGTRVGGFSHQRIDTIPDDIARGIIAARQALIFAESVATNPKHPQPLISRMASEALALLAHSTVLLDPIVYADEDHARDARNAADADSANTTTSNDKDPS